MDDVPPQNSGAPEGQAAETDPLALARQLIDQARAEELSQVELGPLPVLPAPGQESPLELAMQLLYQARLEEESAPPEAPERDNAPLDLAIRLLGSLRDEGEDAADRLEVASRLLEVEEASRREAADLLWTPDHSTPLLPEEPPPVLPAEPEPELLELPILRTEEIIPEWGSIPALPVIETPPPEPVASPGVIPLELVAPPPPPEPALPASLPLLRVPEDVPQGRLHPEAPADEPDRPRLELPDPSELARQLLHEAETAEKADPMALARRLLNEAERAERADPLALARRLLKDARREEIPEASAPLIGAPVEEGAPPPKFDPAGLSREGDSLLGAPELAPGEPEWTEVETTQAPPADPPLVIPSATQLWPPPAPPAETPPPEVPRLALERPTLKKPPGAPPRPARPEPERAPTPPSPPAPVGDRLALERAPRIESTRDAGAYPSPPPVAEPSHTVPVQPVSRPARASSTPAKTYRPAPVVAPTARVASSRDALSQRFRKLLDRRARVEPNDVVVFTRQFAAMVSAGLQLHQALHFYAQSHEESGLGEVVGEVANKVSQGSTLSSALRSYPHIFSEVYTGLIGSGEATGLLVAILQKLAELSERNHRLRQRVLAAITYPLVVLVVSLICIGVFIWGVLPMFVPMFTQLGVELPWPTKVLVFVSNLGNNPYVMGAALLTPVLLWLGAPGLKRMLATPSRRRWLDRLVLHVPYFGLLVEKVITARVLFSLATMLEAGIPFTTCLEKCEHVSGNAEMAHRLQLARALLIEGDSAADCLAAHRVFPRGAIQMIAVGEESAQLSEMIGRVASVYDDDVQLALLDLAAMIEPIILAVMGLVVGFIVLASALPTAELLKSL